VTLAPGASQIFNTSYTLTQADLDGAGNAGADHDIDNTATADSNETGPVSDSEQVPVTQTLPTGGDTTTLALDEEALGPGNPNATGTNPSSTAETASDTTLSFTAGSSPLTTFAFSTTLSGLAVDTDGLAGAELFWVRDSATLITAHFGSSGGPVAITLTLTPPSGGSIGNFTTGNVTVTATLSDNLKHALAGGEQVLNLGSVQVIATATDGHLAPDIVSITVKDDVPIFIAKTDLIYANSSNDGGGPLPGGTGIYEYNIGADSRTSFASTNSDFSTITLSGTVGSTTITAAVVTWNSESAGSALFNFSFNYGLGLADGTLTFDKVAGTYTVELSTPIGSVESTGEASAGFTGYVAESSTVDASGLVDVSVANLGTNFFVQFTGFAEPGGGVGVNNLQAIPPSDPLDTTLPIAAANQAYTDGDIFKQAAAKVSVSGGAAGVASDIMQGGEVLDFDFFQTNPFGFTGATPTAQASSIFMTFDGVGATTDMVVILKLVNPGLDGVFGTGDDTRTTKAIVVDAGDIYRQGDIIPGGFPSLDGNDGLIIIQRNDYNFGAENWFIEGGQVLPSTEFVTGSGINFDRNIGPTGGSFDDGTESFQPGTTDNDNFKIASAGFVTTTTQDANLTFLVSNVDTDGDNNITAPVALNVTIEGSATFNGGPNAESIQGSAGADIFIGGGAADTIDTGAADDNFQDIIRFGDVVEYGDIITNFDVTGTVAQADRIEFTGSLNTLFDDIANDDDFAWASGNGGAGTVNANVSTTVEALFLSGQAGEGVANASLTDPGLVAAAFDAEFNITASNGDDALLVINDTNANSASIWQYTESTGGGEISAGELTLVAVVNSNAAIQTGNLDLAA